MKVVHISVASTGGAGIAAYRLHLALLGNTDIESTFIQQYNNHTDHTKNTITIANPASLIYRIKRKLGLIPEIRNWKTINQNPDDYEIISFPSTSYRIEDLEIVKQADIIHLHWIAGFVNYPTFFKKVKQPIVWTLHDMNPFLGIFHYDGDKLRNHNSLGNFEKIKSQEKVKYIHQNKHLHIVSPSEWLKQKAEKSTTFAHDKHYTIPHGLNLKNYAYIDKQKAKEAIGIHNDNKTILFVAHGLNIHRKGFDLLMEAIDKLERNDFNLISVGGDKIHIKKGINHLHFARIHNTRTLNTVYSASDLTVIPSREDVFNLVMQESIANGTPVVSFNNGGMKEHIKNNVNGILLPEINSDQLTLAINNFLDGKYIFDKNEIRKYAEINFSDNLFAEKYAQLYNHILKQ